MAVFEGHEAYDDAVAALRLMAALKDPQAGAADRAWLAWRIVFFSPQEAQAQGHGLLCRAAWGLYGIDMDGSHAGECGGQRIIDWEADATRIAASIRQAYGIPWERFARETSFRDACAMIGLLPRETPMGTAIYYRTAEPPKPDGRNAERIAEFNRLRNLFAISDTMGESSDAMAGIFASLARGQ